MTAAGAPSTIFKWPGAFKKAFGNWPKAKKSGEVIHQVPTAMDVTKIAVFSLVMDLNVPKITMGRFVNCQFSFYQC